MLHDLKRRGKQLATAANGVGWSDTVGTAAPEEAISGATVEAGTVWGWQENKPFESAKAMESG